MGIEYVAVTGFFVSVLFFTYTYYRSRHAERMELLRTGNDATIFSVSGQSRRLNTLKWGMLIAFAGLGVLMGGILERMLNLGEGFATTFAILFFAGIGLILFYFYAEKVSDN